MAIPRHQKESIYKFLQEEVASQKAVLILSTNGAKSTVNAKTNFQLRSDSRKQGVVIRVAKNTLIQKAFPSTPDLVGQTYLAYLEDGAQSDEVTVPKIIVKSAKKEFADNFIILGAIVNGEFMDGKQAEKLSEVPTHTQSMAQIAGSLNQIMAKIAMVVKEIPGSVARGVKEAGNTKS